MLEDRCGTSVSDATIWRTLHRIGFRLKEVSYSHSPVKCVSHLLYSLQISKDAAERNETLRSEYRLRMGELYLAHQLVCVDVSACDRRLYMRNKAYALEGLRACRKQYFARGKRYVSSIYDGCKSDMSVRYSIFPTISLNGIIECKIVKGSFNGDLSYSFIEGLLDKMLPFPASNSVIVMDNCAIHKGPEIRELIEQR